MIGAFSWRKTPLIFTKNIENEKNFFFKIINEQWTNVCERISRLKKGGEEETCPFYFTPQRIVHRQQYFYSLFSIYLFIHQSHRTRSTIFQKLSSLWQFLKSNFGPEISNLRNLHTYIWKKIPLPQSEEYRSVAYSHYSEGE